MPRPYLRISWRLKTLHQIKLDHVCTSFAFFQTRLSTCVKFVFHVCTSSFPKMLMEEILHQLVDSLSHDLQGCIHPRWFAGFQPSTGMYNSLFENQYLDLNTSLNLGPPRNPYFPSTESHKKRENHLPRFIINLLCHHDWFIFQNVCFPSPFKVNTAVCECKKIMFRCKSFVNQTGFTPRISGVFR